MRAVLFFALALSCLLLLFLAGQKPYTPDADGIRAMETMRAGMATIKELRIEKGLDIDTGLDPAETGLIGADYTDLTTTLGALAAKQTSLNPAFAGIVTTWLKELGLGSGDKAAVCLTGSFPALDIAVLSACQTIGLDTVVFSSVGASTYGANIPGFTWLDMEKRLIEKGILHISTKYASLGGIVDSNGGLDGTGYELGEAAIARHGAQYIREHGEADLVRDIERRMMFYTEGGMPKVFINAGGSVTSLGWVSEAALLDNGLLKQVPATSAAKRGTIFRMYEMGIPVIHLLNIERLAARYGFPVSPRTIPETEDMGRLWQFHMAAAALLLAFWIAAVAFLLCADASHKKT